MTSAPGLSEQPGDKTASETLDPLEEDMEHDGADSTTAPPITGKQEGFVAQSDRVLDAKNINTTELIGSIFLIISDK